jgi:hypothetical protein
MIFCCRFFSNWKIVKTFGDLSSIDINAKTFLATGDSVCRSPIILYRQLSRSTSICDSATLFWKKWYKLINRRHYFRIQIVFWFQRNSLTKILNSTSRVARWVIQIPPSAENFVSKSQTINIRKFISRFRQIAPCSRNVKINLVPIFKIIVGNF